MSLAEIRHSMGLAKKAHIRSILEIPRVREVWSAKHGCAPSESAVERLYAEFIPTQIQVLANHSELIPGVAQAVARMRSRGLKIGTTTGYNRAMLDYLLERAAAQGFVPDSALCPDDVSAGRPLPWMCYLTALRLEVYPLVACVKIGDTPADIEEGRNAGMWTIGVTRTGNETGVTEQEWSQLSAADREVLLNNARQRLERAGAHYTVPSVAECDAILDAIDTRIASGQAP